MQWPCERKTRMPDDEIRHMEKHPPCCVGQDIAPASAELTELIQADYGSNTTVFALRCSCGEDCSTVSLVQDGFGPVSLKCARCATQRTVFDPLKHGYDGAVGNNQGMEFGTPLVRPCPKCGASTFQVAAGFQYSGETDILEHEELDIKPEDLFSWFVLGGKCSSCGQCTILADIECA